MHVARFVATVSGLAAGLLAQTTHVVGPGGFPQISAALAVAQPGDVLLVAPGAYAPFTVHMGVRIIATGQVGIAASGPPFTQFTTSMSAPPGQTLYVRGLRFSSSSTTNGHSVGVGGGQVVLEDCTFEGGHPAKVQQGLNVANADVVLRRCTFPTGHRCLVVGNGTVAASDCRFLPFDYGYSPAVPLNGILLNAGAVASFAFCEIRGATVAGSIGTGGSAVLVQPLAKLRLCDCQVFGGDSASGAPVPAIVNSASSPVEHSRSSITGGLGLVITGSGGSWQPGPAFVGPQALRTLPGTIASVGGVQAGAVFTFTCTGSSGGLIVVPMSFELSPPTTVPLVLDPVRFDLNTLVVPFFGLADAAGVYQGPVIAIPPGVVGASLWLHPLLLDGASFVAGVPIGGVAR